MLHQYTQAAMNTKQAKKELMAIRKQLRTLSDALLTAYEDGNNEEDILDSLADEVDQHAEMIKDLVDKYTRFGA